jgi:hypothetical protein
MKTIEKVTFDNQDAWIDEELSNKLKIPVITATNFHVLNRIVGYAKYINGPEGNIYFRGQSELYDACFPSLLRGITRQGGLQTRGSKLKVLLKMIKEQVHALSQVDDEFLEPLMQHYGIATRWIDLVDNVWVALWFGLHDYRSVYHRHKSSQSNPYLRDYVHVAKRKAGYLYLLLIHSDAVQNSKPGYYVGKETKVVDLRTACTSIFLRPHAQHGLLVFSRGSNLADHDYYKRTVGIVKIAVPDALAWIGEGNLLTHANMYPSPVFDTGYHFLLDSVAITSFDRDTFGTIKVYTLS